MGPTQISFFAYYMGAPLDQLYRLLYGAPIQVSFCAYNMGPPQISFCAYYMYMGAPQVSFFAYYRGPLRSASSLTIWGPSSQFLCLLYGGPLRPVSSLTMWGPTRSVSSHTIYEAPPQVSFFAYYIWSPLRSVS